MPITVNFSPFRSNCLPTSPGSPPRCCCQNPLLMTTTGATPPWKSALPILRPSCGDMPSNEKKSALTCEPSTCSARLPPVKFASQPRNAASWLNCELCSLQSRKFAGAGLTWFSFRLGTVSQTVTMRSRCGNGNGRSSMASIELKTVVFAPIPKARVITATAVKPGRFHNCAARNGTSCSRPVIIYSSILHS